MKKEKQIDYSKSRFAPEALARVIAAVNELPQDLKKFKDDLNELSARYDKEYLQIIQKHGNRVAAGYEPLEKDLLKLQSVYANKLRRLITPKLAGLLNTAVERNGFENARLRLRNLVSEKRALLRIIDAFNRWQALTFKGMAVFKPFEFETPVYTFSFNEDATLELSNIEILDILTKEKIPIEKIRVCRVCPNIFWKKRSDSPTCSSSCLKTFNDKRFETKERITKYTDGFEIQQKKLEKQKETLDISHPLIQKQMQILDKIQNKLEKEKFKYGTL